MLFPIFETTREQYRDNLLVQLSDPDCIIFFDTNLFSQLFKLYAGARNEFYNWFTSAIIKERVKITNWSMQEYNNRAINNKLGDYLDGVQVLDTVKKHLNNSVNFLHMFYDREVNKGSYASKEDFMADVNTVKATFAKITDSVKLHENTVNKLNSEFALHLQPAVISSDIYSMLSGIQQEAEFRFQNNMPPGYKDDPKSTNKYGDLIIWKEILGYCKEKQTKSLIFVSNDGKKDFVYHPMVLKPGGKKTTENDVRFPDPRLFDEFRTASNGEKFSIISFATLISLLQEGSRDAFLEISTAIQLAVRPTVQPSSNVQAVTDEQHEQGNMIETNTTDDSAGTVVGESEKPEPEIAELLPPAEQKMEASPLSELELSEITVPTTAWSEPENSEEDDANLENDEQTPLLRPDLPYDQKALADGSYVEPHINPLPGIVEELASYDWYRQNDAMIELQKVNTKNISDKNLLFVLGRRIYSAACGNAFEAIRYLEGFASEVPRRGIYFLEHVANGIFYEIYFNNINRLRRNRYKDNFIELVFSWQTIKDLAPTIDFINKALEPYKEHLLLAPSRTPQMLTIELICEPREEFPKAQEYLVSEMTIGGRVLTKKKTGAENPFGPEFADNDFHQANEQSLLAKISYKTAIPTTQLILQPPKDLPSGKFAVYTLKHDRKIEF